MTSCLSVSRRQRLWPPVAMQRQGGRHTCADNYRYIRASGGRPNLSVPSITDYYEIRRIRIETFWGDDAFLSLPLWVKRHKFICHFKFLQMPAFEWDEKKSESSKKKYE